MFFCLGFSLVQDLTYMSVPVCVCWFELRNDFELSVK